MMNRQLLLRILLVAGILVSAGIWLRPHTPGEHAETYSQPKLPQTLGVLPMNRSLVIIFAMTGLLSPSCIPGCWPRDFTLLKPENHYVAYVMTSLYNREAAGRTNFEKSKRNFPEVDSSFYSLINDATINYETVLKGKVITVNDVRALNNERVAVGLIDRLKGKFSDNDLGYIQVSPVITNDRGDKGLFFYETTGEFMTSWLICIKKIM